MGHATIHVNQRTRNGSLVVEDELELVKQSIADLLFGHVFMGKAKCRYNKSICCQKTGECVQAALNGLSNPLLLVAPRCAEGSHPVSVRRYYTIKAVLHVLHRPIRQYHQTEIYHLVSCCCMAYCIIRPSPALKEFVGDQRSVTTFD